MNEKIWVCVICGKDKEHCTCQGVAVPVSKIEIVMDDRGIIKKVEGIHYGGSSPTSRLPTRQDQGR
jgi:hypothetical protein